MHLRIAMIFRSRSLTKRDSVKRPCTAASMLAKSKNGWLPEGESIHHNRITSRHPAGHCPKASKELVARKSKLRMWKLASLTQHGSRSAVSFLSFLENVIYIADFPSSILLLPFVTWHCFSLSARQQRSTILWTPNREQVIQYVTEYVHRTFPRWRFWLQELCN